MPAPGARRLATLLDRLLRPRQAAENAGVAAAHTTDGRVHRQRVEQEVASLTDDAQPPDDT